MGENAVGFEQAACDCLPANSLLKKALDTGIYPSQLFL